MTQVRRERSSSCTGIVLHLDDCSPPGFVCVERCRECERFKDDVQAAEFVANDIFLYCLSCNETVSLGEKKEVIGDWRRDHDHHDYWVVVLKVDALLAGFLSPVVWSDYRYEKEGISR